MPPLCSNPDLSAQDVRNAAASLENFHQRLTSLPVKVTLPALTLLGEQLGKLAGNLNRLADHLDAVQKHVEAGDLKAAQGDLQRIKAALLDIKGQMPVGGDRLDPIINNI